MGILLRNPDLDYVHPEKDVYAGLWCLWAGATGFLALRLWAKLSRRLGLWYDDYILMVTWVGEVAHLCASRLRADHVVVCPDHQRYPHHDRVCDRLRDAALGCSHAHPHRYDLLPHPARSEPV